MSTSVLKQRLATLQRRAREELSSLFEHYRSELYESAADQELWTSFIQLVGMAGITPRQIADQSGVSFSAVERYKEGRSVPHPAAAKDIVDSIEKLFDGLKSAA